MFCTRFAPSPTGPLHLGHAFSALLAWDMATAHGGEFLLRIEDIDQSRAREAWEQQIYDDLHWLGIRWKTPVMRQSERMQAYGAALDVLWDMGLLYVCTCSRADIAAASAAPQEGVPASGPDGLIYPGTCRTRIADPVRGPRPAGAVLRLDLEKASRSCGQDGSQAHMSFMETGHKTHKGTVDVSISAMGRTVGDIVLARRDMGTSYHLSVVVDDADQGVSHVARGADLFDATQIHVLLQKLLNLPTPVYHHHRLIRDGFGKRLAKRDDARAISKYKDDGCTPEDIREMAGLSL